MIRRQISEAVHDKPIEYDDVINLAKHSGSLKQEKKKNALMKSLVKLEAVVYGVSTVYFIIWYERAVQIFIHANCNFNIKNRWYDNYSDAWYYSKVNLSLKKLRQVKTRKMFISVKIQMAANLNLQSTAKRTRYVH